jgi:hypothetical protein
MNLAGLTPGHYMNYLMLLSDLRDSVLYFGGLFSLPQLALCVYITFYLFVRCGASQLLPSGNATFHRFLHRDSPILDSFSNYLFVTYPST